MLVCNRHVARLLCVIGAASSGSSGICSWGGAVWWLYFQLGSQNYTIAATDPRFWESRVRQCPPEADVFSLNYTLILDFWSMVYYKH